jgi:hypothetical protein
MNLDLTANLANPRFTPNRCCGLQSPSGRAAASFLGGFHAQKKCFGELACCLLIITDNVLTCQQQL